MAAAFCLAGSRPAGADRNVLAPRGLITVPGALKGEFIYKPSGSRPYIGWINYGVPDYDLSLEIEAERLETAGQPRETLSLQYSFTGNAFTDIAPALSVGVRDVLRRGREAQSFFIAASKQFGLSLSQERVLRSLYLHLGYGTSRLGGLYVGAQAVLPLNLEGRVEYVAHQVNAALELPLVPKRLYLRVNSLDGDVYYGVSFALAK